MKRNVKVVLGCAVISLGLLFTGCQSTMDDCYDMGKQEIEDRNQETRDKKAQEEKTTEEKKDQDQDQKEETKKESTKAKPDTNKESKSKTSSTKSTKKKSTYKCSFCGETKSLPAYYKEHDVQACKYCITHSQESDEITCEWCEKKVSHQDSYKQEGRFCSGACAEDMYAAGRTKSDGYYEEESKDAYNVDDTYEEEPQDNGGHGVYDENADY